MSGFRKIQTGLMILLMPALFCSYHPVIRLGGDETMNFELSVTLIWLVVFDLVAGVRWWRGRGGEMRGAGVWEWVRGRSVGTGEAREEGAGTGESAGMRSGRKWRAVAGVGAMLAGPVFLTLSCIWSENWLRGVLTAGVMWLVVGAVVGMGEWVRWARGVAGRKGFDEERARNSDDGRVWGFSVGRMLEECLRARGVAGVLGDVLVLAGVGVGIWCWVQCGLDVVGVGREWTLMCAGCTYQAFGFPHPSGLAIEPQFMGGLLLAPSLVALYRWQVASGGRRPKEAAVNTRLGRSKRTAVNTGLRRPKQAAAEGAGFWRGRERWAWGGVALFLCMTLFLTFSRGAIYAFGLAVVVVLMGTWWAEVWRRRKERARGVESRRRQKRRVGAEGLKKSDGWAACGRVVVIPVVAFGLTLVAQGGLAAVGPTSDTFVTGVTKAIHHLSLGLVDLRPTVVREVPSSLENYAENVKLEEKLADFGKTEKLANEKGLAILKPATTFAAIAENSATNANFLPVANLAAEYTPDEAYFDGYAAVSTDTRVKLNRLAVETWRSEARYTLAGTGLGGAGVALYARYPELGSAKEIVQNEYVSLLLETGILGYLAMVISVIAVVKKFELLKKVKEFWREDEKVLPGIYLLALIVAYAATLGFFSGPANALYIYLLMPLGLILWRNQNENGNKK